VTRKFVVTAMHGHIEVTSFGHSTPSYVEVVVTAENVSDESIKLRYPIDTKLAIGDIIEIEATP
jgi:hypothetical protein